MSHTNKRYRSEEISPTVNISSCWTLYGHKLQQIWRKASHWPQVRSHGMPFGGCKESGTGMAGTRLTYSTTETSKSFVSKRESVHRRKISWFIINPLQALPRGVHQGEDQLHQDQLKYSTSPAASKIENIWWVKVWKGSLILWCHEEKKKLHQRCM